MSIKNRNIWGQVLQNINVSANYTRILKSWSFNYFEEYILWLTSSPCDKGSGERPRAHVPLIYFYLFIYLFIFDVCVCGGGGGIVVYLIHLFKSETILNLKLLGHHLGWTV